MIHGSSPPPSSPGSALGEGLARRIPTRWRWRLGSVLGLRWGWRGGRGRGRGRRRRGRRGWWRRGRGGWRRRSPASSVSVASGGRCRRRASPWRRRHDRGRCDRRRRADRWRLGRRDRCARALDPQALDHSLERADGVRGQLDQVHGRGHGVRVTGIDGIPKVARCRCGGVEDRLERRPHHRADLVVGGRVEGRLGGGLGRVERVERGQGGRVLGSPGLGDECRIERERVCRARPGCPRCSRPARRPRPPPRRTPRRGRARRR